MKKIICVAVISLAVWFPGCKSQKIQIIHTNTVVTNGVPVQTFNDESYIWESWKFSTNSVDKVD